MAVLAVKISVKNSPAIAGWLPRLVLCIDGWRVVNGMMEHVTGDDRNVNESGGGSDSHVMAMEDKRMADKRMKTQPMRSNTLSAVRSEHARNPQPMTWNMLSRNDVRIGVQQHPATYWSPQPSRAQNILLSDEVEWWR